MADQANDVQGLLDMLTQLRDSHTDASGDQVLRNNYAHAITSVERLLGVVKGRQPGPTSSVTPSTAESESHPDHQPAQQPPERQGEDTAPTLTDDKAMEDKPPQGGDDRPYGSTR